MTGSGTQDEWHPKGLGDMSPEEFERQGRVVVEWIAGYFDSGHELPVFPSVAPGHLKALLSDTPPDDPEPFDEVWSDFVNHVVPGSTHWNQPGFHAYFANSASGPGVLGEMAAAALNANAMIWRSAPAGTELEELATDWVRQLLGLPSGFRGVINDTASSSTLYALTAARVAAFPSAQDDGLSGLPPGRVYLGEAHSSIDKAVLTLGLGRKGVRRVETDHHFGLRVDALRAAIREDQTAGARPTAVVATVGTTSAVSVDPVAAIADVCEEFGLWLHVDAAYAGPIAICPEFRSFFEGWERADSIVVNPHKWLFTPMDCSVLFTRKPEAIRAAFSLTPSYLQAVEQGQATNLMDYGIALGRRMRSLKLWFVMRYFGRSGLQSRLREHVRLARWFAHEVETSDAWETVGPTNFGTCVFRFAPSDVEDSEADRLNLQILEWVNDTGEAFLSSTVQLDRVWLRMSIGHLRTDEVQVRRVWELLTNGSAEVTA
jgi:aromatic-L-amino-acid/L-tryptophan decarboxylase